VARPPARLEYDGEYEGIDNEHQQGIEKRPRETQDRAAITAQHLALCQLHDQFAVVPKAREQRARRRRVGLIHCVSHFGTCRLRSLASGRGGTAVPDSEPPPFLQPKPHIRGFGPLSKAIENRPPAATRCSDKVSSN